MFKIGNTIIAISIIAVMISENTICFLSPLPLLPLSIVFIIDIIIIAPIDIVEPNTKIIGVSCLSCSCGGASIFTFSVSIIFVILGALE